MNYQSSKSDRLTATTGPGAESGRRRWFRYGRVGLIAVLLVAVGLWTADWLRSTLLYVHETDARVVADVASVSSRVAGWVVEMPATAGLQVDTTSLLARVDGRDAALRLRELNASLAAAEAERERIVSQRSMVDQRTQSQAASAQSKLTAAEALTESSQAELTYARAEFLRAQKLSKRGIIATKDLDRTRTAYLRAQQDHLQAVAEVATASAAKAEAEAERHQLDVLARELSRLDHRRAEILARIERQKLDIEDRRIVSPVNGVVSKTFVTVGEHVIAGQRIAMVHNPQDIWIEANVRETELRRLAVGQEVQITVDAYPDEEIVGTVERIGHATTSEFSLLPSSNPSGNFTKVTQRLPIRIAVEQRDGMLRPGMMVEVYIDVRGR